MTTSEVRWIVTGKGCRCWLCERPADCPDVRLRRLFSSPVCALCAYAMLMAAFGGGEKPQA